MSSETLLITDFSAFEKYSDHNGDRHAAVRVATMRVAIEVGQKLRNHNVGN